jgi:Protein of unknown function (DUF1761)
MIHILAVFQYLQTHLLSVFLAIIVTYVIGFIWHGPLFGKEWMRLNKITPPKKSEMKMSMMYPGLTANLVLVIAESAVLGRALQILSLSSIFDALIIATIIWLPFTALTLLNINSWAGKPLKVTILDAAHAIVSLWAVAAVLYWTL